MIDIFGKNDIERWAIVCFISISLYLLWTNNRDRYNKRTMALLSIPRLYLIGYYILVIFDAYAIMPDIGDVVRIGTGSVYGVLLLFAVEAYVRRQNRKYGRC